MADGELFWHNMKPEKAVSHFHSSIEAGLDHASVAERRLKYGMNELAERKKTTILEIFLRQFRSLVVAALMIAAGLSFFMGEYSDVIIIVAVLLLNAAMGTYQEYRAEKALEALKRLSASVARVVRGGIQEKVPAAELVPGDIFLLEVGDRVPADGRIVSSSNLRVNESAFTGESVPAQKGERALPAETPLAERANMVYKDTIATSGRCTAIAVATGMRTEIGRIADKLQAEQPVVTPLQARLANFMKLLGIAVLISIFLVIFLGKVFMSLGLEEIIRLAIAQTVSLIPEGLPVAVTIVLVIGVGAMAARKAIVRRLPAVETLGCVTAICTDKTGTLTRNEMTVERICLGGSVLSVTGSGYGSGGDILEGGKRITCRKSAALSRLMEVAVLCNDSAVADGMKDAEIVGDPTEGALLVAARKAGMDDGAARKMFPRAGEVQFDPEKKYMATFNKSGKSMSANVKGAPERVLEMCTRFSRDGRVCTLTDEERKRILEQNHVMAGNALRVLGFAYKDVRSAREGELHGMVFAGLIGMHDPPREEAKKAIQECRHSGIRVMMVTGDHKLTAMSIAKELGMVSDSSLSLTGAELDELSDAEFGGMVDNVVVYARMSSEHKLRIVRALQDKGHIVAMTGDGVNDALAIKRADIGVAMGLSGTEVTKESSDMVLANDNFATIVAAIEEGRGVYANIQKIVSYMMATNMGEILFLFAILLSGLYLPEALPLALLPIHILWVNLVTDGTCFSTLAMEPKEKGLIRQKPRDPNGRLITGGMASFIVLSAVIMAAGTMAVFYSQYILGSLAHARTMAFTTLAMFQIFSALNVRSRQSLFKIGLFSNKYLLLAIIASIFLQLAAIYLPFMNDMIHTTPLTLMDWATVIGISSVLLAVFEIRKALDPENARE